MIRGEKLSGYLRQSLRGFSFPSFSSFYIFIDYLGISHHVPPWCSPPSLPMSTSCPPCSPYFKKDKSILYWLYIHWNGKILSGQLPKGNESFSAYIHARNHPSAEESFAVAGMGRDQLSCTHATAWTACTEGQGRLFHTHRHEHGFRCQLWPWASSLTLVVIWTIDINMAVGHIRTLATARTVTLKHGLRWLHMPLTPAWRIQTAEPEDISKALDSSTDHVGSYGSQASSLSGEAAWTSNTNIASCAILDHTGPLRRSNPEDECCLTSGLHCCPEPGGTAAWQQLQHLSLCLPKLKAIVHHAVLEPFVPTLPPN